MGVAGIVRVNRASLPVFGSLRKCSHRLGGLGGVSVGIETGEKEAFVAVS